VTEIDAGQHDFRMAGGHEPAQIVQHQFGALAAAHPSRTRHDAERAPVLAAFLDLQERPGPERPRAQRSRTERGRGGDVGHFDARLRSLPRADERLHQFGDAMLVGVADDEVRARGRGGDRIGLGPAAGDDDARTGMLAARAPHHLAVREIRATRHGAGVDDDDVRATGAARLRARVPARLEWHRLKAARFEPRLHLLRIDLVEAAAQGRERDPSTWGPRNGPPTP
jgi:hypothetical protein